MSITSQAELEGMQAISEAVGATLRQMREYAQPGMSTQELDDFGGELLRQYGARSAPRLTYGFPGWTCISLDHEMAQHEHTIIITDAEPLILTTANQIWN